MNVTNSIPERGDVIAVELLQSGKTTTYILAVLSPSVYNSRAKAVIGCIIVADAKGNPFEVALPEGTGMEGVILSDHLHHVDLADKPVDIYCSLPYEIVEETVKKAGILLEL